MNLSPTSARLAANRPMLAGVLAALSLGAASTAHASPFGRASIAIAINGRHCEEPRTLRHCEPVCDSYADRERERGMLTGRDAGFDAGYRDGIRGTCYSDCPTASFCRVSDFFERGYRAGFSRAYADGYARGKAERHRGVPRCR
jgi:hypothetical protein